LRTVASPNRVIGTQTGSGGYNDSYGYLSGFPPNVVAEAVIYKDPTIVGDASGSHEVELLFRVTDTANSVQAYEVNLGLDGGYTEIMRWNGPLGNYTAISHVESFPANTMPPVTGDVFKATCIGNEINVYINKNDGRGDLLINTGGDNTYATGQPGIGMWLQGSYSPAKYGFTSYSVVAHVPDTTPPSVPLFQRTPGDRRTK
jgi:hypothetical protein